MKCLLCHSIESRVHDSRFNSDRLAIRRRRECTKCQFRFSTLEQIELLGFFVKKKDGHKEPYDRCKLKQGLLMALEKRRYNEDELITLITQIELDIQQLKRSEILSCELGDIVLKKLYDFDKIAYIRFASVYKKFDCLKSFQEELNKLNLE